jgi:hypothetical protein
LGDQRIARVSSDQVGLAQLIYRINAGELQIDKRRQRLDRQTPLDK